MPELPEVETVIRILNRQLPNSPTITNVILPYAKIIKETTPTQFCEQLIGRQIVKVSRRGKYIIFDLDHFFLVSHLRMEGKWFVDSADTPYDEKHVLVRIILDNGYEMRYHDTRRFGTLNLRTEADLFSTEPLRKLGPEPFVAEWNEAYLTEKLAKKSIAIKTALLDQEIVAGIGNIYASEICWHAFIHPEKVAKFLDAKEIAEVVKFTSLVLSEAIESGGTTIFSFQPTHDVKGEYYKKLRVYGRAGQPCYRCKTLIKKTMLNQRGTYYCPKCQAF